MVFVLGIGLIFVANPISALVYESLESAYNKALLGMVMSFLAFMEIMSIIGFREEFE